MGNIVVLDELTINKIAAGEVIERPASVVKEMIENSIDAGATKIDIEIQNGGISKIRITDNGKGIALDDMSIAFERHATSKIRVADDLEIVKTMGFRGEALASIAAISRVEMFSRTQDSEVGNKIIVEGGNLISQEQIGVPVGTSITVENLFYNTPVRYKFLKKDYTEAGYIEDAVTRLALSNPQIAFKLSNNGKVVIQTPGNGNIVSVIYSIYGKTVAENCLPVEYLYEDMKITGVIGKPEIARSNRANQLFFVNNRFVKDKNLSAATEQAFKGMLPIGKFGFLVLNLEMDPKKVDVNVHPAKLEVRFAEEGNVFKAIMYAIKETLLKGNLVQSAYKPEMQSEKIVVPIVAPENKIIETPKENKMVEKSQKIEMVTTPELEKKSLTEFFKNPFKHEEVVLNEQQPEEKINMIEQIYNTKMNIDNTILKNEPIIKEEPATLNEKQEQLNVNFEEMYEKTFGEIPTSMRPKEEVFREIKPVENISIFDKNTKYTNYKFIGSAFSTYIILEISSELYIIDQHAAHERILYEEVKRNYYSEGNKNSQLMLVPDVIALSHKEMCIVRENVKIFEKAGFMVEEFGENTVKLSGVPDICLDLNTKSLFLDILDEIDTVARTERQEVEEKFIATVACKAAVKANMSLEKEEVDALMKELLKLPNPFTCPHGRPTAIKMTKIDIEKKFSRR